MLRKQIDAPNGKAATRGLSPFRLVAALGDSPQPGLASGRVLNRNHRLPITDLCRTLANCPISPTRVAFVEAVMGPQASSVTAFVERASASTWSVVRWSHHRPLASSLGDGLVPFSIPRPSVAICLAVGSTASAQPLPIVVRGVNLPDELAGFLKASMRDFESASPGLGYSFAYNAPGVKATAYICLRVSPVKGSCVQRFRTRNLGPYLRRHWTHILSLQPSGLSGASTPRCCPATW